MLLLQRYVFKAMSTRYIKPTFSSNDTDVVEKQVTV